jgi:hypothetical protein
MRFADLTYRTVLRSIVLGTCLFLDATAIGQPPGMPEFQLRRLGPVRVDVAALSFQGTNPETIPVNAPGLSFQGTNPPTVNVGATGLSFQGTNPPTIAVTSPGLSFQGLPRSIDVASLSFQGTNPPTIPVTSPMLSFQGTNPPTIIVTSSGLSFQGTNPPTIAISTPTLSFQGVPAFIETDVTTLSFQGTNPPTITHTSPGLTFQGTNPPTISLTSSGLSFQGTGVQSDSEDSEASEQSVSFQARRTRPRGDQSQDGHAPDGRMTIRLREDQRGAGNLRRLSVLVYLGGRYEPPRRGGHQIILSLHEGPSLEGRRPRDTRPVAVPGLPGGDAQEVALDLSLRGSRDIAPGRWPEETRANAHAWYRHVLISARIDAEEGQIVDRTGPYCYDAASMRFTAMSACRTTGQSQRR